MWRGRIAAEWSNDLVVGPKHRGQLAREGQPSSFHIVVRACDVVGQTGTTEEKLFLISSNLKLDTGSLDVSLPEDTEYHARQIRTKEATEGVFAPSVS